MIYDLKKRSLDAFVQAIIRRKVQQLVGRAGIRQQDATDLSQDILLRLLRSTRLFDERRAHPNVYITAVVERHVANILRGRLAAKRHPARVRGLDEAATEALRCHRTPYQQDPSERAMDVDDLIDKLPDELRILATQLRSSTVSELSHELRIPRTTLQYRVRKLRSHFERAGLKDYLGKRSSI